MSQGYGRETPSQVYEELVANIARCAMHSAQVPPKDCIQYLSVGLGLEPRKILDPDLRAIYEAVRGVYINEGTFSWGLVRVALIAQGKSSGRAEALIGSLLTYSATTCSSIPSLMEIVEAG